MALEVLQVLWYLVIVAAVIFYVMLDGFDLGVGALQIFGGSDKNRRIFLNSIGPFWDGNEVWLIIIVGGLFVGFPDVYAVTLSGFYMLFMAFLCGVVFRAVAIEFRSKLESPVWRGAWDFVFWLSSLGITFGAGVVLGNLVQGVPIDATREIYMPVSALFFPYSIFIGILSIFLFAFHGNVFLLMKTEGSVQKRLKNFLFVTAPLYLGFLLAATTWTWISYPYMTDRFREFHSFLLLPIGFLALIITTIVLCIKNRYGWAFLFSMLSIAALFSLFAVGTFPNLVISSIDKALYSLDLYNSSASELTLIIALIIAVIGVPLVLGYGWLLYHVYKGKTVLHEHSY